MDKSEESIFYLKEYVEQLSKTLSPTRIKELESLESLLGVKFKNIAYLDNALTHTSYSNERSKPKKKIFSNQRLEFFGDAILSLIISEYIFISNKDFNEGRLSQVRSIAVSRRVLVKIAKSLNFGNYIKLGKGEISSGANTISSVLEDALEAVIAVVYLDLGAKAAERFILKHFKDEIEQIILKLDRLNFKSMLQECVQKHSKSVPEYKVDKTEGPGHKIYFHVSVLVDEKVLGKGSGYSKKDAEVMCAKNALELNYKEVLTA